MSSIIIPIYCIKTYYGCLSLSSFWFALVERYHIGCRQSCLSSRPLGPVGCRLMPPWISFVLVLLWMLVGVGCGRLQPCQNLRLFLFCFCVLAGHVILLGCFCFLVKPQKHSACQSKPGPNYELNKWRAH